MAKKKKGRKKATKPKKEAPMDTNMIHLDEQLEGALMRCMGLLKGHCSEGGIIVKAPSGKWKVLTFGSGSKEDNFHKVLGNILAAGVMAIEEGPGGAAEWEV